MPRKKVEEIVEEDLSENEEFISRDDIDIEVMSTADEEPTVYVKFTNFADEEDAEEYAEFLAETLPLLLFETTRLQ
jgi:SepF-like predicted cell division protein (DUF552 family)